jgi:PAS domain S-box-containing protein
MLDSFLSQVVDSFPVIVDQHASLPVAIAAMQRASFTAIWVTTSSSAKSPQFTGAVFPEQLLNALSSTHPTETALSSIVRTDLPLLTPAHLATVSSPVEWLLAQFEAYGVECLPLVNGDGTFLGAVNQWKLLKSYCRLKSPDKLEKLLKKANVGFFTMMLDQPLMWNTSVDRDSALDYAFTHQRIHSVNEAMSAQYGLRQDELIGKTPSDFFSDNPTYGKQVWQRFLDLGFISETTHERRLDDHTDIWIEGFYNCLYDDQGCILGHVGIQRNVTKIKQVQSRLIQRERYVHIVFEIQQTLLESGHRFIADFLSSSENFCQTIDTSPTQFSFQSALSNLRSLYQDLLRKLGVTAQASRVCLAEHRGEGNMSLQLTWQEPDLLPHTDGLWPDTPYPPEWLTRLATGQVIDACPAALPVGDRGPLSPDVLSVLVLPLILEGQLWGVIQLENCQTAEPWEAAEIKLLTVATSMMVMHLENCQVSHQFHNSWRREWCTRQLIERIRQTLQIENVVDTTTRELRQLLGCDRTVIYRFNSDWSGNFIAESVATGWTSLAQLYVESPQLTDDTVSTSDCSVQAWQPGMLLETDTYLQESQGGEYRQGKPYSCVVDIDQTDFDPCYPQLIKQMQAVSYLTVPIFVGDRLWGLLANYQNQGPRQWSSGDINLVMQIATQLSVALQHVDLLEQSRRQALELAQAKIQAEAASQARTDFLANVSHELRTPLNAIVGFSQIMAEELAAPTQKSPEAIITEYPEYINIINRNSHHLLKLVNNVIEIANLESNKNQLTTSKFDLWQLLQDLKAAAFSKADKKRIRIDFRLDPDLPKIVVTDRRKLFKVLITLINNAINSTKTGSVILRVAVITQVAVEDGQSRLNVEFEVEDTGRGLHEEDLKHLFHPLTDTHKAWQKDLELGLSFAVSRKFINMMGGDISVSSTFSHGSLFKFNIWALTDPLNGAKISPDNSFAQPALKPSLVYRILIADDQPQNHAALQKFLQQVGCELRTAPNSREAFSTWYDWQPHLMLIQLDLALSEELSISHQIHQQAAVKIPEYSLPGAVKTKVIALVDESQPTPSSQDTANFDDMLIWPAKEACLLSFLIKYLPLDCPQAVHLKLTHEVVKQDLATTSLQWRQQLRQATIIGSDKRLTDLISQLPSEHSLLAETLNSLTVDFQFEQILALLENP